jgi:hypothetical protein
MAQRPPNEQWDRFKDAMRQIVSVPHSEIKALLDKEQRSEKTQAHSEVEIRRLSCRKW